MGQQHTGLRQSFDKGTDRLTHEVTGEIGVRNAPTSAHTGPVDDVYWISERRKMLRPPFTAIRFLEIAAAGVATAM